MFTQVYFLHANMQRGWRIRKLAERVVLDALKHFFLGDKKSFSVNFSILSLVICWDHEGW